MRPWKEGDLNPSQERAVLNAGSSFVIACPGSGKTRTLTYKIIDALAKIDSHRKFIIAITYTNRAADEICDRIEALGIDTSQLWIGTIHSFCLEWILKPYAIYIDELKYGYRVINSHDSEKILTEICGNFKSPNISYWDCGYHFNKTGYVLHTNHGHKVAPVKEALESYFSLLRDRNQIDFELILYYAYHILNKNTATTRILASMIPLFLVDEYQDTKEIQYEILALIMKARPHDVNAFFVGDPNQAIYQSLGGFAMEPRAFASLSCVKFDQFELELNYRSSSKIIDYFSRFSVTKSKITSASEHRDYPSVISFNTDISKDLLEEEIVRAIQVNIEKHSIDPSEICILAPWWVQLASMTRRLVARLPQYPFDGPGTIPFARDPDNFWYKVSKIVLTEPSPKLYIRRVRWANDVINDLECAGILFKDIDAKRFLRISNSIELSESNGLTFLEKYFDRLFCILGLRISESEFLSEHYQSFFDSSRERIERLKREGLDFIDDTDNFKNVFKPRSGITVSSIHGIKGAEFDAVIAYALLEDMVPHFSDSNGQENANRMLYVIGSRARKNLFLFSETGRVNGFGKEYIPTRQLERHSYQYDTY